MLMRIGGQKELVSGKKVTGWTSQGVLMVKNPPTKAGDLTDIDSIPGSGRSLEEGTATHSSILAWRTPWTEVPGRLQSTGLQRAGHD